MKDATPDTRKKPTRPLHRCGLLCTPEDSGQNSRPLTDTLRPRSLPPAGRRRFAIGRLIMRIVCAILGIPRVFATIAYGGASPPVNGTIITTQARRTPRTNLKEE